MLFETELERMDVSEGLHAEPFLNQVGGHHACAKIPLEGKIAKPVDDHHEQHFYERLLSPRLREFVPRYYGLRDVEFSPSRGTSAESDSDDSPAEEEPQVPEHGADGEGTPNPWGMHCFDREVSRLRDAPTHRRPCIILEDLTFPYQYPCVLDIKLGTRAHPDDMDAAKAARSQRKCAQTTSASAGLRLCGMQRYDARLRKYVFVNKYHGRSLRDHQLADALLAFLPRREPARARFVIARWLGVLRRLEAAVRAQQGYRFYSSSLLLMYEGASAGGAGDGDGGGDGGAEGGVGAGSGADASVLPRVDVRLIDFAHTRLVEGDGERDKPDEGFLFGLENLMTLLSSVSHGMRGGAAEQAAAPLPTPPSPPPSS